MSEAKAAQRLDFGVSWLGYIGGLLLLLGLMRASLRETWDGWCTLLAAGGAALLISWSVRNRQTLRQRARLRGVRYGGQTLLSSLLLLALLSLVNFLAARHNVRYDLTEGGVFTLADQTKQVLQSLTRDVRILAFFPKGRGEQAADLLRRYAEGTRRLRYEIIDPDQQPDLAQKYGVTAYGTTVLEVTPRLGEKAGERPIRIEPEPAGQRGLRLTEESLTNALLKVMRGTTKTLYFVEGHGEADINSADLNGYARLKSALEAQAFVVKPLFLARLPQVPADCTVLVIAGPGQELLPDELAAIRKYLEQGGAALILIDPAPGAGLEKLFTQWGIRVGRDLIVDVSGAGRAYGAGPAIPLVTKYNTAHPITKNFRLLTFFPMARSLTPLENPGDALVTPLVQTSDASFAQAYDGGAKRTRFDPSHDRQGPFSPAIAVSRQATDKRQARLVVFGSSNFVINAFFDKAGNGDFLLNSVNWLASEEELIAIRPRPRGDHRIQLTEQQVQGVFWLTVILMPALALVCGVTVYRRRR